MIIPIFEQVLLYIPLLLGAYISIHLMKIPNFGIESSYIFGAIVASQILLDGAQGFLALVLVLVASAFGGAIVGMISAILEEKGHFSHVLSAIITIGLFQGIAQMVIGGSHIGLSRVYNPLKYCIVFNQYPELFVVFLISLSSYIIFILFMKTQLGMSCAIYGNNKDFFKNYRMNQSYVVIAGMAISSAFSGVSGYLIAQSNGFVDLTMGMGLPLLCLSSLIIGKSIRGAGKFIQVSVPLLGVVGYFVLQAILLNLGFDLRYFSAVQAVIVAALLLILSKIFKQSSRQNLLGI